MNENEIDENVLLFDDKYAFSLHKWYQFKKKDKRMSSYFLLL